MWCLTVSPEGYRVLLEACGRLLLEPKYVEEIHPFVLSVAAVTSILLFKTLISSCFDHTREPWHTIVPCSPATRYCVQRSSDGMDGACRRASPLVRMRACGSLPIEAVSNHFATELPAALPMTRKNRSVDIGAHSW